MKKLQDRIRGSLIGGAAGDALGYPVEFYYSLKEIQNHYGPAGITRLDVKRHRAGDGKAVVSDDTQMTLFTANGLLNAAKSGVPAIEGISNAYVEWYFTQTGKKSPRFQECWIASIPELNVRRAPGTTCMSALADVSMGRIPENNSKGCGGVMRIAPIPLYAVVPKDSGKPGISVDDASLLAGEAARITHKHPLGFIPAALEAYIIYRLALDETPTRESFLNHIREGLEALPRLYPQYPEKVSELDRLIRIAVDYASNRERDVDNIESLGGGWVGDEALAIALYCALKHFDSFEKALIAAVNHAGDSDSTGAVCGNILGAAIGYEAIPSFFKTDLEMHDLILQLADDLFRGEITG